MKEKRGHYACKRTACPPALLRSDGERLQMAGGGGRAGWLQEGLSQLPPMETKSITSLHLL